jgi:serine/threonine protein kinase/tetratricopeptide (TPR) repeat protein
MDRSLWQKIDDIFESALELPPAERAAFLDRACAGDEGLRSEVETLIKSDLQASGFLEAPALEAAAALLKDDEAISLAGQTIGPYKIIREIGHGGMGTVYLAMRADDHYRKQVAIKLIGRGMDTRDILSRFRHERQILANLEHPNIARLLDGGTAADGLPYFVMEYIEGQPIDQYCDARKLGIAERLKLFRTVCAAVHYAHQNLVIHRDIKPGNILVTAEGTSKLLDFGIAKLLDPELATQAMPLTATAMRPMTPDYASPEQVRGLQITTASDIYSLGVLLYELLTGRRPYRLKGATPQEIERLICEQEPQRPSDTVAETGSINEVLKDNPESDLLDPKLLRGDLDNIVLKAMRKEPDRRYASAAQFSEDLRRHLEGLPVIARKDTFSYRAGKFVRRHKRGVVAAALVVLALMTGLITTLWQARNASAQRARAERRFNDVRRLANSFMFEVHDAVRDLPGSTPARELIVRRALEYLDTLAQEVVDDPVLQGELATAYQKVGDVQGNPYEANLGDTSGALKSYRKALAIRESLVARGANDVENRRALALNYVAVSDALSLTEDFAGQLENYRRAATIFEELTVAAPARVELRRDLSRTYTSLGDNLRFSGQTTEALEVYRKQLRLNEAIAAAEPNGVDAWRRLANTYGKVGDALQDAGDLAEALRSNQQSVIISESLIAAHPTNATVRSTLLFGHLNVGDVFKSLGDFNRAVESYQKAMNIAESLSAVDPTNVKVRADLAYCYNNIGEAFKGLGDEGRALGYFRKALAISEKLAANDPLNKQLGFHFVLSHQGIGEIQLARGDLNEALESFRQGLTNSEAFAAAAPANIFPPAKLAKSYFQLGQVHAALASDAQTQSNQRREHWREGREWFERSRQVMLDMQRRNALNHSVIRIGPGTLSEIERQIARCDSALSAS